MPRKPRNHKNKKTTLTPVERAYLTDDHKEISEDDKTDLWCLCTGFPTFFDQSDPKQLWRKYRDEFLPRFIWKNPGRRPLPWWQYDAPRWCDPYPSCWFHGTLEEPRRRLGGIGTPSFEVLNYVPSFYKGIPTSWITEDDVRRCGPDFAGKAIDPEDPPIYESQTAYLQRHGLLSPVEIRYIEKHQELFEPERVILCH